MQLPHYEDIAELAAEYGLTEEQTALLERVSRRAIERASKENLGQKLPPLGQIDQQERQAAEAIWYHVGYVPPICDWPWDAVQDLVGSILPGEVWVAAGQSGNGKSQWVANLLSRLVRRVTRTFDMTVATLERKAAEFRGLWACLELGYPPALAFKKKWSLLPDGAERHLLAHMNAQVRPPLRERVVFAPDYTLDRKGLSDLIRRAQDYHHRLVIVDHLHQMDHGDGPENRMIRETMKLAKHLAQDTDMGILFTAQLNRGHKGDSYQKFYPPDMSDLQGSSAIEQIADGVLLLYRPLRPGIKKAEIDAVRMGQLDRNEIFRPNTMAVRCGKHRLDGEKLGRDCYLHIQHGVIRDQLQLPNGVAVPKPEYDEPSERGDAWEPAESDTAMSVTDRALPPPHRSTR